jgi:hypothetical protein
MGRSPPLLPLPTDLPTTKAELDGVNGIEIGGESVRGPAGFGCLVWVMFNGDVEALGYPPPT